ncbi:map kinase kinase kinase mkh1 [Phtheirospermum japonicum]|uniref:Map kinase kinase kinase mkh1 n=1 Tax=Phtheirospermum japonicum TaxID=374723 RepID=A0A830BF73_9LAMI|nr:map kinase kinase kinase mkh1 [Phtheirospermum japonicum]
MLVKELEKIETNLLKQHENDEEVQESKSSEENNGDEDLKLDTIIDISGRTLDYPLMNGEERPVGEVYMYKNELNLIPSAVGRIKSLKTLKFFSNQVNLFPGEFGNLVDLECLQAKIAEMGVNGLELSKLRNLKELELSRVPQRPSAFPILSEIAGLKCLTRLSVCHFSIRYLPPEIGCLMNLEHLDLSFNKMRNLPDEITSLKLLVSLKIANNKLIDLPLRLSYLQRLENLDLSNNRLTSLECLELESMHNLQILNLQYNQLRRCRIPSWICCSLEGNARDLSHDEAAEMDVNEDVIKEIHGSPCTARRAEGWKRRYNMRTKAPQEQSNNCKKWKVDAAAQMSSDKYRVSADSDNASSEDLSIVADAKLANGYLSAEGEGHGNSLISPGDEDFSATKETVNADGLSNEAETDNSGSNAILDSLSEAGVVLDGGSSSQSSNYVSKSKRHSEKDLDNPKPTKSRRSTNDPSYLSCQYSEKSFCGIADHLPDGFYDAGRDRPFMPLGFYEKNLHVYLREVILLDRKRDEELDAILLRARAFLFRFKQMTNSIYGHREGALDDLQIASLLALFVSDHFGGSDKNAVIPRMRKAVSGSNLRKPFVCTCETGIIGSTSKVFKQGLDTIVEDVVFHDICEKSLQSIKERRNSVIVPIGGLQFGVCRHRALLMKYLCDRIEPRIPCELVRGYLDFSPHAWNVIVMKKGDSMSRMIVDACHPHDIREESDPEYFCSDTFITSPDASPNCSFPCLTACDEIEKLASSCLMRCSVGQLEAAVKKLSIAGEKHVAPDLALLIARDVASALTELHSRHIIHRDVKSDNILIDLDKKRPDGSPTVKICDFDRAIPLHSYMHTCCDAHIGIPPPDICVGTPRWMAPEVFRAMHQRSLYGLEVDIWSFGCVLLELLTLQVPYADVPESEIHKFLQMGERSKLTDELDALAQSESKLDTESETLRFLAKLYHQCTEKNPVDRPSAEKIYNLLVDRAEPVIGSTSLEQE